MSNENDDAPLLGSMTITYESGDDVVTATGVGVPTDGPFSQFVVLTRWKDDGVGNDQHHPIYDHLCIATNKIISIRCNVSSTFHVNEEQVVRSAEMRDIMFEHEYQQHQNNTNQGAWE